MELFSNPIFNLFFVLSTGLLLSKIKVWGISIGPLGILLSSFIMGNFGILLPKVFETFGLILFIYAIGIQAGAGIFKTFSKRDRSYILLCIVYFSSAAIVGYIIVIVFNVEKELMFGIASGSLIYASGIPIAIDATGSSLPLIGYGISYPFGLILTTIFADLFTKIFRRSFSRAQKQVKESIQKQTPEFFVKTFKVDNPHMGGKTLTELKIREITGGIISKVKQEGIISSPTPDTVLNVGDHIKIIGNQETLDKIKSFIGPESEEELELSEEYQTQTALVTNSKIVNKSLKQLSFSRTWKALITEVNRSGIDLTPHPSLKLQMGDKVTISARKNDISDVMVLLGNNDKKLLDVDFLPISIGIVLGVLVGLINFSFLNIITISPSLVGGVLIVSILLGKIGKTGPIIWNMSTSSCRFFEEFGILLFVSTIGTNIGNELPATLGTYGFTPLIYGAIITLLSLSTTAFVGSYILKMNTLETLESVVGITGNPSGMSTVTELSKRENTKKIFALIFPIALILIITIIKLFA